jgi:hypothetical protein
VAVTEVMMVVMMIVMIMRRLCGSILGYFLTQTTFVKRDTLGRHDSIQSSGPQVWFSRGRF